MDLRNNYRLSLIALVLVFTLCSISYSGIASEVGKDAADFCLESIKGEKISLSDYKGSRDIILTFWASWCPYCVSELKDISQRYFELRANGFEVLAINVKESRLKAESFAEKKRLNFPILLDPQGSVARQYGVGIPAVFMVDKQGKIRFRGHQIPEHYLDLVK